ncbi:MAG: hypothetical protein EOM64_09720 [Erysipelotrichia bacterium]|nr:hypothetical protein [Erysipelotrichia bacterium]
MSSYLSIDCGGTRTDFLLTDGEGRRLAFTTQGPGNYIVCGLEHVIRILKTGTKTIMEESGIWPDQMETYIAMAGYGDIPEDMEKVKTAVREALPNCGVYLGNDSENAIAGSLVGKSGIHLISGTGSIGLGADLEEKRIRVGGWHHLFGGDEGSAYWMACLLLQHFTKQADGREKRTILYDHMMERYHLSSPQQMLKLVIGEWDCARDHIASMSRDVYELALEKDPFALDIFEHAAEELFEIVRAIKEQGNFAEPTAVSFSGGVFATGSLIINPLQKRLRSIGCDLIVPVLPPLGGGILMAMSQSGELISDELIRNLKEAAG